MLGAGIGLCGEVGAYYFITGLVDFNGELLKVVGLLIVEADFHHPDLLGMGLEFIVAMVADVVEFLLHLMRAWLGISRHG